MKIKTFAELIEWTRTLHENLARCLLHCASLHRDERASMLLEYLAAHESEMETMVAAFKQRADPKAADTFVYDYIPHKPITVPLVCDNHYAELNAAEISAEVFNLHGEIISLYRSLLTKADIPEAEELMQALLDMEENETKQLASQVGRMHEM